MKKISEKLISMALTLLLVLTLFPTIALASNVYTVSFDGNGADGGTMANQVFSYGTSQNLTPNAYSLTGRNFVGWSTSAGGALAHADGASVLNLSAIDGDTVTLYAVWTSGSPPPSVVDTTAANSISPATAVFDKTAGAANNKDVVVTLTAVSGSLSAIKNGSATLVEGTDYTKSGNKYTIKAEYLASLPAGTATLVFDMSSGIDPALRITVNESEIGTTTPEPWANPFIDVNADDWFFEDVAYVVQNGLFNGTSANTFSPNAPMTRGMVVTVLGRLAGIDIADYSGDSFDDVDTAQWYAPYVKWAAELGIVNGVGDSSFAPEANISRQDLAVILYRYAEIMGINIQQTVQNVVFADSDDIADYAAEAIAAMVRAGVITGRPGSIFDPTGIATRAEVAAMLHRFCEAVQ